MTNRIRILLIDRDAESRATLSGLLSEIQGVVIRIEENWDERLKETFAKYQPELAVVNLAPDEAEALDFAENLQKQYPSLMIIITAPQMQPGTIRRAMRWGVREFLPQPYNREEVDNAVQAAIKFKQQTMPTAGQGGEVICLFGSKGGIGTTTIATSLAIAMARSTKKKIILLDLHLQLGHATIYLNVKSKYSLLDVVNHLDGLDVQLFFKTLPRHPSGVYVLSSPFRIEEAEFITAAQIERLLAMLRQQFDVILIDTHSHFDEVTIKSLDKADKLVLISSLDLATIFNSRRCLELFFKLGYGREKIKLVLNRYASYSGADLQEMEKLLEYPVLAHIPMHDYNSMMNAINQGAPVIEKTPRAKISEAITALAEKLIAVDQEAEEPRSEKGGLFGKFRK